MKYVFLSSIFWISRKYPDIWKKRRMKNIQRNIIQKYSHPFWKFSNYNFSKTSLLSSSFLPANISNLSLTHTHTHTHTRDYINSSFSQGLDIDSHSSLSSQWNVFAGGRGRKWIEIAMETLHASLQEKRISCLSVRLFQFSFHFVSLSVRPFPSLNMSWKSIS
jgi:hypothetical protein